MWRVLLSALLLAGCVQLPPSPQDIQAKKFESIPDKAVIYIVRNPLDQRFSGTILLDDLGMVTTQAGTYYRWEVTPGPHRIAGYANESSVLRLQTEAGKLYFVQHSVVGYRSPTGSFLQLIPERDGRELVMRGELLARF
ncbi:MAG: hypothetical protein HY526_07675 [Betaproteobacteria bacterium]|nr:hypothetical protein [Betaproteobacteria bacterium]